MCGLFGIIDSNNKLTQKEKAKYLKVLSSNCEERGVDATGYAYIRPDNTMRVFKKPLPAHKMRLGLFCDNPKVIMGHTRFATQGDKRKNYNNHPFYSHKLGFALAHNGILSNDASLREDKCLPKTYILTDSYIAVQLLEEYGKLNFESICDMAEDIKGSFCFTILSKDNELYIVKGDNPIHIVDMGGWFMYASTFGILFNTVNSLNLNYKSTISPNDGDILKFRNDGIIESARFNYVNNYYSPANPYHNHSRSPNISYYHNYNTFDNVQNVRFNDENTMEYIDYLYGFSEELGLDCEFIYKLMDYKYSLTEIEDILYGYKKRISTNNYLHRKYMF